MSQNGSRSWPAAPAGRIAILDVDPDLAGNAGPAERAALRKELTAPVYRIGAGALPEPPEDGASAGYLVLKGLLLYEVSVCGRATAELLGPGDLVRPRQPDGVGELSTQSKWAVLEQVLLADLGDAAIARSADVVHGVLTRCCDRAYASAVQRTIAAHVRVDVRVLAYLWHLADRFGVVTPGAVKLELPLTHAVLARLVGARRPTVTTALQRLMELGYLRREGRAFVLVGDASAVDELDSRSPARDFALPEAAVGA
jgi:CRP/FNR family cyclic AMP-dependent transcriptional regulator